MSDHDEMLKAKALIQAKRYEDARALLITLDHPKAQEWLDRLNSIPAAATGTAPDYTTKAIMLIVLYFVLFIPGLLAGAIWSKSAKRDIEKYGDVPGASLIIGLNSLVFWAMVIIVVGALVYAILASILL